MKVSKSLEYFVLVVSIGRRAEGRKDLQDGRKDENMYLQDGRKEENMYLQGGNDFQYQM